MFYQATAADSQGGPDGAGSMGTLIPEIADGLARNITVATRNKYIMGDLLTRCVLATRRAEYARCVRMGDEAVRTVTFALL